MEIAEMKLNNLGITFEHNHPCSVCREKHSVLDLSRGIMRPCWDCQEEGYQLYKFERGSLIHKLVKWVME